MIATETLSYQYPSGPKIQFPDFQLAEKDNLLILGQSGCGKTTLLHLLAGLRRPTSGEVEIKGKRLSSFKDAELDRFRGSEIGIVFQKPHFINSLSVEENFRLLKGLYPKKVSQPLIDQLINRLGLNSRRKAAQWQLSEGEKQRVSIGLALCMQPSLLLADEPTSSLDDGHCEEVVGILKEQSEQLNTSLIIVTHDQRLTSHFSRQIILQPLN